MTNTTSQRGEPIVAAYKGRGYTEREYGAAMQKLCYGEGKRPAFPEKPSPIGQKASEVQFKLDRTATMILRAISDEMEVAQIRDKILADTGENISRETINGRLNKTMLKYGFVTYTFSEKGIKQWSKISELGRVSKLPPRAYVDDVAPAIMDVLDGEMSAVEIAYAVSAKLDRAVSEHVVRNRLQRRLGGKVSKREIGPRKSMWSKSQ